MLGINAIHRGKCGFYPHTFYLHALSLPAQGNIWDLELPRKSLKIVEISFFPMAPKRSNTGRLKSSIPITPLVMEPFCLPLGGERDRLISDMLQCRRRSSHERECFRKHAEPRAEGMRCGQSSKLICFSAKQLLHCHEGRNDPTRR